MRFVFLAVLVAVVSSAPAYVKGEAKKSKTVALAPVEGLRETKGLRRVESLLSDALSKGRTWSGMNAAKVRKVLREKHRLDLRSCDGKVTCLAELGSVLGSEYVVHAEVATLGDAQVIYLKLINVATATELRSTTFSLGDGNNARETWASLVRLLAPSEYVGSLHVASNVEGATIFLDGRRVATTPAKVVTASVGSHAMRVTHPEYQDFVQFVDVVFEDKAEVTATLRQLAGVEGAVSNRIVSDRDTGDLVRYTERPWYKRWYVLAGSAAAVAVVTTVVTTVVTNGVEADEHLER